MDELYHHGIKGQKWGIRRTRAQLGYPTATRKKKSASIVDSLKKAVSGGNKKSSSTSSSQTKPLKVKKKVSQMNDDELKAAISRLELEKRYKDLSSELTPKKKHTAQKFVSEILTDSAKNIGKQTTTYLLGEGVNKLAVLLGSDDPHIVNSKKGQKDK